MIAMKMIKNSKYVIGSVVCSLGLLIASNNVGAELASSLLQQKQASTVSASGTNTGFASSSTPALPPDSVWAQMGPAFQFDREDGHAQVIAQIKILQANKKDLYRQLQADAPYINYFFQETQKRGMPAELALLPVIESDCSAEDYSKVGALGYWQFMPATAHDLGLKCGAHDERKDLYASTHAALNFLSDLHQTFKDDWILALAAYNWGPGNVSKAMKRSKPWYRDVGFWDLKGLPLETQQYAPKLLALAAVIHHPERYGIVLPPTLHLASAETLRNAGLNGKGKAIKLAARADSPTVPDMPKSAELPVPFDETKVTLVGTQSAVLSHAEAPKTAVHHVKGVSDSLTQQLSFSAANI